MSDAAAMPLERRPTTGDWREYPAPPVLRIDPRKGERASVWRSGPLTVISTIIVAELPRGDGTGPQWHLSITRKGKRPKPTDLRRALRAFNAEGAEEDNHHPGQARNFWIPVDPKQRVDCACKEDEVLVTDGAYQWSNDPTACRGCELEALLGPPCHFHSTELYPR